MKNSKNQYIENFAVYDLKNHLLLFQMFVFLIRMNFLQ